MGRKVKDLMPAPFSLEDHLDVEEEAKKFGLPAETAREIAKGVQKEEPQVLVSLKLRESELREKFRDLYNLEVSRRQECQLDGCAQRLTTIEQAIAHIRWHLMNQNYDGKLARATILDVESQLFPQVEKELQAVLGPSERKELLKRLEERRELLEAELDVVAPGADPPGDGGQSEPT